MNMNEVMMMMMIMMMTTTILRHRPQSRNHPLL